MREPTAHCADCDMPIVWTKQEGVRVAYEMTGETLTMHWNATTQWHEPRFVLTYRVHLCPALEALRHAHS